MQRIELDNRKKAVKSLKLDGWNAMPVENKAHPGTPDLNAAKAKKEIWIEFKILEAWPKRAVTAVKIKHFSTEQKNWFRLRIKHNPNCFIIIQIEEDHFLYRVTHDVIANLGKNWNKERMIEKCLSVRSTQHVLLIDLEKGLKK